MTFIDDQPDRLDLTTALAAASPQRRAYTLRYRQPHDQRLCLAAYGLLESALRTEFGIKEMPPWDYSPAGKPFFVGHPDLFFNLSHCREAAACVVDRRHVGIDVESIGRYDTALCMATMNADEQHRIACSPNAALAFTRLWTMKESLLKLTGEGMKEDMTTVLDDVTGVRFETFVNMARGYVCTVCRE